MYCGMLDQFALRARGSRFALSIEGKSGRV
jgi:hypothetical protein